MRECISHHHACDCREALMRDICQDVFDDHGKRQQFKSGAAKPSPCQCFVCKMILELYPGMKVDE